MTTSRSVNRTRRPPQKGESILHCRDQRLFWLVLTLSVTHSPGSRSVLKVFALEVAA